MKVSAEETFAVFAVEAKIAKGYSTKIFITSRTPKVFEQIIYILLFFLRIENI